MAIAISTSARYYANVIPARLEPGEGSMALIAGFRRFVSAAVACRSAHALSAVMAGCTLPRQCGAMIETRPQESGSVEVAAIARRISHDVTGWHRRCHNTFAQRMATVASLRRTFEHPGNVTRFARCRGMTAGERETGSGVIEVAPGQLRLGHRLQREHS